MEQQMNCFQWQNHVSDFLDETLTETDKHNADEHLETCKECTERLKHYRQIIAATKNQPKSSLPAAIKKAPLSFPLAPSLSRSEFSFFSVARWQKIPWYFRTLIEGSATVVLITAGISGAPRLKDLYERNFGRNLSENLLTSADNEEGDMPIPSLLVPGVHHGARHPTSASTNGEGNHSERKNEDDLAGESEQGASHPSLRIGSSQLWRFTLKTVSPDELRPKVILALRTLKIPEDTPGLGGNQVPGGIEFDLILSQSLVPEIKKTLEKLAPESISEANESHTKSSTIKDSGTFSWYRVKSKRKIPEGKSQVVIWLSQS